MGVLTIPLNDIEEASISGIMRKYNIATKTGAMRHASAIVLKLEDELQSLRTEKKQLQSDIASYRESSLELLSGISGLRKLTNTKL